MLHTVGSANTMSKVCMSIGESRCLASMETQGQALLIPKIICHHVKDRPLG